MNKITEVTRRDILLKRAKNDLTGKELGRFKREFEQMFDYRF